MWKCYIAKTKTGELLDEIEIPTFSWELSLSAQTFTTTENEGFEEGTASSFQIPWDAVPGDTLGEKVDSVQTGRRSLVMCWEQDGEEHPVLWGAIGDRTDTFFDTSFELESIWDVLSHRYVVEGAGDDTETESYLSSVGYLEDMSFSNRSYRGLASRFGAECTRYREYGDLPIVWSYSTEKGSYSLSSDVEDLESQTLTELIQSLSGQSDIFAKSDSSLLNLPTVSSLQEKRYGPDMTFRPRIVGTTKKVQLVFMAGTDDDIYIDNDAVLIDEYNNLTVQHLQPVERVYVIGEEESAYDTDDEDEDEDEDTEDEPITGYAQNLSYCQLDDGWPLREDAIDISDENWSEKWGSDSTQWWPRVGGLRAMAEVDEASVPLAQISMSVSAYDLKLGQIWPGDIVEFPVSGFPSLDDGTYFLRIGTMQGDQTTRVTLTFDVMEDPSYPAT